MGHPVFVEGEIVQLRDAAVAGQLIGGASIVCDIESDLNGIASGWQVGILSIGEPADVLRPDLFLTPAVFVYQVTRLSFPQSRGIPLDLGVPGYECLSRVSRLTGGHQVKGGASAETTQKCRSHHEVQSS